jgi:F420-dependent methylenetetrahydromethanopterin dehydrogenase
LFDSYRLGRSRSVSLSLDEDAVDEDIDVRHLVTTGELDRATTVISRESKRKRAFSVVVMVSNRETITLIARIAVGETVHSIRSLASEGDAPDDDIEVIRDSNAFVRRHTDEVSAEIRA